MLGSILFAEVPEDSADAKKWPLWRPPEQAAASSSTQDVQDPSPLPSSTSGAAPQPPNRPGPRKSKTTLANIPIQKARKLSTLEKSAMVWSAHVNTEPSDMKDELDANRRSGGYLEKVEFFGRVEARKEEALGASKSTKRRR